MVSGQLLHCSGVQLENHPINAGENNFISLKADVTGSQIDISRCKNRHDRLWRKHVEKGRHVIDSSIEKVQTSSLELDGIFVHRQWRIDRTEKGRKGDSRAIGDFWKADSAVFSQYLCTFSLCYIGTVLYDTVRTESRDTCRAKSPFRSAFFLLKFSGDFCGKSIRLHLW